MWLCAFLELESVSECLFSYNSDIKKIFFGWPNKESGIVLNVIFVLYIYGQIHWIYKYLYERHKLANQHFLFYFQNCFCNAYCDKIWLWLRPRENFYIQWYKNSEHLVLVNRCTWMSYHKIYLKLINTGINLLVKIELLAHATPHAIVTVCHYSTKVENTYIIQLSKIFQLLETPAIASSWVDKCAGWTQISKTKELIFL